MHFTVCTVSPVPDVATARRLLQLDDLDDEAVCKVLFHRRKQQTGGREALRRYQLGVAAMTLLHAGDGQVRLEAFGSDRCDEDDMLRAFFDAGATTPLLVSWDGNVDLLPLLHFSALRRRIAHPAYWHAAAADPERHLDLRAWLTPPAGEPPGLDEAARTLGLPGMAGLDLDTVLEAWLAGRHADVHAFSTLRALNVFAIALRVFEVTGRMDASEASAVQAALREAVERHDDARVAAFADAGGNG